MLPFRIWLTCKKLIQSSIGLILREPVPFLVITSGRTGSNLLLSLLNSHPSIYSMGEAIGQWRLENPDWRAGIASLGAVPYIRLCLGRTLLESVAGIKILYHQVESPYGQAQGLASGPDIVEFLRSKQDLKVIHLKRRNRLKTLASRKVALISRQYLLTDQSQAKNSGNTRITLSVDVCEQEFTRIGAWEKLFDETFRDHPLLEVFYEDLADDKDRECGRILEFLGVRSKPLNSDLKRQNSGGLSKLIDNYWELKAHFSETSWARYFED